MKKSIVAFGLLASSIFYMGDFEVKASELSTNPLIESLKQQHPNWIIEEVSLEDADAMKQRLMKSEAVTMASAPPLTGITINRVISQVGTPNEYPETINAGQTTSHEVSGKTGVGVIEYGYGNDYRWLGSESITFSNPDYEISAATLDFNGDRIVDGFYNSVYFDSDVKIPSGTSKLFKFRSVSQNYPINIYEKSITIPHE